MPGSAPDFHHAIQQYMMDTYPSDITILDVGAGEGTYARLLGQIFKHIDAVEVFPDYIKDLTPKYRHVYLADIRQFKWPVDYDVVILGAVLEHMNINQAQDVLRQSMKHARHAVVVTLPFMTPQGAVNGNRWEIHMQSDLTAQVVRKRYPQLKRQAMNDKRAWYLAKGKAIASERTN